MFLLLTIYSLLVILHALKLPVNCFLLILKLLGAHAVILSRNVNLAAHVRDENCINY